MGSISYMILIPIGVVEYAWIDAVIGVGIGIVIFRSFNIVWNIFSTLLKLFRLPA